MAHPSVIWTIGKQKNIALIAHDSMKPAMIEWCEKNKLCLTGHILHEDNLACQVTMCGSIMRFFEYMSYPGMDNLGSESTFYTVPELVSSAAKQLGRKNTLDELYGCTGWHMNLSDYKRIGDWQRESQILMTSIC